MMPRVEQASACDPRDGTCHLCGDTAVSGHVVKIDNATRTAIVAVGETHVVVALDLVDAEVGDELLVHLGFAIERLEKR
ncbi:MAG: HypC/HybG/HupF family hydrogenase formation chaperone [Gemmatimonadaceae bacterium]